MNSLRVLSPGMFTTVQDLGRDGYGPLGISPSGAADAIALRLGNRLLRNPEGAPALEMTLLGGSFVFSERTIASLAGSDFGATLDAAPVQLWTWFEAKAGQTLALGATRSGARCYLCVQGGIAVKPFLGSGSTHVLSALGGHEGRQLRQGDLLHIGSGPVAVPKRQLSARLVEALYPQGPFRVTAGPQSDWFTQASLAEFFRGPYRVTEESNRMGLRLDGPPIRPRDEREMITEGVSLGAIQVPASGQPIILFVEQQTTGGYPKIANIIAADLARVGQLRPRDEIRFELVSLDQARSFLHEQEALLRTLLAE